MATTPKIKPNLQGNGQPTIYVNTFGLVVMDDVAHIDLAFFSPLDLQNKLSELRENKSSELLNTETAEIGIDVPIHARVAISVDVLRELRDAIDEQIGKSKVNLEDDTE